MDSPKKEPKAARKPRGRPRAFTEKTDQNTIKSLHRAIEVLKAVSRADSVTLSGLAEKTQDSPATVYRILVTLEGQGIVESDPEAQTWHIGPEAFMIGSAFLRRTSLIERSRPVLRRLMEMSGETANLGIADGDQVLFVSQVETHAPIRAFFPPGTRSELHASGIGKVLLAELPERALAQVIAAGLPSFTPNTLVSADSLKEILLSIRRSGHAIDDEEHNLGMRCIAAPVRNAHGETVAGLSVSGPTSRVTPDKLGMLAELVMRAADEVTVGLGGHTLQKHLPERPPGAS